MIDAACPRAGAGRSTGTVIAALRRFAPAYRAAAPRDRHVLQILEWIGACRTPALGGRQYTCACGYTRPVYNSCGDRHCPQCRGRHRKAWLDARCQQLLPVPHFQVVATLPAPLRALAWANPRRLYSLMFRALAHTLQQFAAQRLHAQLGIVAVLHTWRHDLHDHPHVHALVTAGGLHLDEVQWVPTRDDYLFPTRPLAAVFRGKLLEGLRRAFADGRLRVPAEPDHAAVDFDARLRAAYRHRWVIHVEPPQGRDAATAAKFLARYVQGPPIADARILAPATTACTPPGTSSPATSTPSARSAAQPTEPPPTAGYRSLWAQRPVLSAQGYAARLEAPCRSVE